MQLTSNKFAHLSPIPAAYTCKGENISPSLRITDVPSGTKSLALIMHDPDAPNGDFLHWTMWNISPLTDLIEEGTIPQGALQGINSFGVIGYGGPCPPSGTHRYVFDLYALDSTLGLPEGVSRADLEASMKHHIIAQAQLVGLFGAS